MGYKAQRAGANIEGWVDASLKIYYHSGLIMSQVNYPEISQRGYQATVIGKAGPDRTVAVLAMGGRCVQLEIKTWGAKDEHLYSFIGSKSEMRRRLQYDTLIEWQKAGALAFYLVCWRYRSFGLDWRLYPVNKIPLVETGLAFSRQAGLLIPVHPEGWPDWLNTIIDYANGGARV